MDKKQKVLAAMSGGVDSSVAAALLKQQGYDLVGITMNLYCASTANEKGCCGISAADDAKKVADKLGFPHYVLNFKDEFQKYVIENFIEEYKNGRTPNPCVRCNQFIKFDLLLKKAKELGCDYVATGHYARIQPLTSFSPFPLLRGKGIGERGLFKGKDPKKDQSYFLYTMDQEALAHTLFPLCDMTKQEVRKIAKDLCLPVHDKKESQEICFVEDDNYARFLKENVPDAVKQGPILDKHGKVVGKHNGIAFYTIGQRKGIGAHRGKPKYVIGIDRERNVIIIGDDKDALSDELMADHVTFVSEKTPDKPLEVTAKIRYNSPEAEAILYPDGKVVFKHPQRAVTPGQSVVFYNGEAVVGGGIIN